MRRREFLVAMLAPALTACGADKITTAPEAISAPSSSVPLNRSLVGERIGDAGFAPANDNLAGTLTRLGWNPNLVQMSGVDTCTKIPFNGFLITSVRDVTPKSGIVFTIDDGHYFVDNPFTLQVQKGSKIEAWTGVPYSGC